MTAPHCPLLSHLELLYIAAGRPSVALQCPLGTGVPDPVQLRIFSIYHQIEAGAISLSLIHWTLLQRYANYLSMGPKACTFLISGLYVVSLLPS